jgi:hypothetical protein
MKLPMPAHADRITLCGETAWIWSTELGWSVLQGTYQIDLENCQCERKDWHTIDWSKRSLSRDVFEGGLFRNESGHLENDEFVILAAELVAALRRKDQRELPDLPNQR